MKELKKQQFYLGSALDRADRFGSAPSLSFARRFSLLKRAPPAGVDSNPVKSVSLAGARMNFLLLTGCALSC